jgi:hypothetical protein
VSKNYEFSSTLSRPDTDGKEKMSGSEKGLEVFRCKRSNDYI